MTNPEAIAAFNKIEPEKFGLKKIADACWEEASRLYANQYELVVNGVREKPDQERITRAFAFAKFAQIIDIALMDEKGFWNALRRVKAGGHF